MATVTCGWCKATCHMTMHGTAIRFQPSMFAGREEVPAQAAFLCDGCGRMSVCLWVTSYDEITERVRDYRLGPQADEEARWYPMEGHHKEFPDVPDQVAKTATEAWTCHTVGAYRGAVMLARAVVEAAAKSNRVTTGTLEKKINELAERGAIRATMAQQAHEIRFLGNSAAHGDLDDPVTKEESEEVLFLMGELLRDVWQVPTRGGRLAAARAAKSEAH